MRHDVAVVGGGPAGAWTAYQLARRGARVVLFDPSHPREKPCGGGVTGRALALVASAIDRSALTATAVRTARFTAVSEAPTPDRDVIVTLGTGGLVVASRSAFDAALLHAAIAAGAEWCAARVTEVAVDRESVRVDAGGGSWHAAFLVGADGPNSLVRRRLAAPFRRDQLSIATGFFARGVSADEIVIEMASAPAGYIWSFPRPDHLAIGICAQADAGAAAGDLRERARRWIAAARIAPGAPLDAYSWPIPSLSAQDFGGLTTAGPRWCLVGDAAGLVDPITREGIFFALASGAWAADAISGHGADDITREYRARVHDEAAGELCRAARLKADFFRPAFTRLMMRGLRDSAAVRAVMADLIAGAQPYSTLKWRLLKTLDVTLAWRALTSRRSRRAL